MKRYIRGLINWFNQWVGNMCWIERVAFAIGGLLGVIVGIAVFLHIDKVPATQQDYQLLEQQAINIQQNPKLLFETNCNISINNELITVRLENEECKIYVKYNKNFEILSYSKNDNYTFLLLALVISLIIGIGVYSLTAFILVMVIYLFYCFKEWYKYKKKPGH